MSLFFIHQIAKPACRQAGHQITQSPNSQFSTDLVKLSETETVFLTYKHKL